MSIHYLPVRGVREPHESDICPTDVQRAFRLSNALSVTQRSPGWNNRKPDIVRVQLGACTLLAVPYRRWAWRRYEIRVAEQRSKEA